MTEDEEIVGVCARGRLRQRIRLIDLPLPNPPPRGSEWIEAYPMGATEMTMARRQQIDID